MMLNGPKLVNEGRLKEALLGGMGREAVQTCWKDLEFPNTMNTRVLKDDFWIETIS